MRPISQLNTTANRPIHLLDHCCHFPAHLHQIRAQLILHNLHPHTTVAYHFIAASQSLGLLNSTHLLYTQLQRPHVFICNTLIKALSHSHSPCHSVSVYTHMFKSSVRPNNYTFPFLLKSVSELRDLYLGNSVHAHVVKLGLFDDIYVQNSLMDVYASGGSMDLCRQVFDEMSYRDVVSWTVMIDGFNEAGKFDDALITFEQMQYSGVVPNRVTMVNALSACSSFGALEMGVWIHDFIRRSGWDLDVILGTSLVEMYGKCGRIEEGLRVFQSMKVKNGYTWNALIKGLALAKSGQEAVQWFFEMYEEGIKPDEVTLICVLSAYSHSGMLLTGRQIFNSLSNGLDFHRESNIMHV